MFAIVSASVKFSETAESYGWVGSGQLIGAALGSAIAGFAIDGYGSIGGFATAFVFSVVGTAVGPRVQTRPPRPARKRPEPPTRYRTDLCRAARTAGSVTAMTIVTLPRLHWGSPEAAHRALIIHGPGLLSTDLLVFSARASAKPGGRPPRWTCAVTATPRERRPTGFPILPPMSRRPPRPVGGSWDVVIGHSIGAAAAVVAAHNSPQWTKQLILLDPALLVEQERKERVRTGQLYGHDHLTEAEVAARIPTGTRSILSFGSGHTARPAASRLNTRCWITPSGM